jgi:hypothetical protein
MSELDDAIRRLNAAVARLEAAADPLRRPADDEPMADQQVMDVAAALAGRIDAALAKLALLLDREE